MPLLRSTATTLGLVSGSVSVVLAFGLYLGARAENAYQSGEGIPVAVASTEQNADGSFHSGAATGDAAEEDIPVPDSIVTKWEATKPGSPRADSIITRVADSAHLALYQAEDLEDRFPSAQTCATCHPKHYEEWSTSPHAYAQMSPVFNAFQGAVLKLTNGTNGDFCIRCHSPVGMNLGEEIYMSNMDRHPTSREGITCVVCHRLEKPYGKVSGRLAIAEGDIFDPVFGSQGGEEVERVVESDSFRVNTERGRAGRAIHRTAVEFASIDEPGFCGTCHDVNLLNGFRLEEAFSEYKTSPAADRGVTCQDCHMGKKPGVDAGYAQGPAAVIGRQPTEERKITNHLFAGPDYSIVHPGIFPHNTRAAEMASISEWLKFDVEAGWGTDEFERNVPEDYEFPDRWQYADDRYSAREIIEENQERLDLVRKERMAVMRAGFKLGEVKLEEASSDEVAFSVEVRNGTDGHNVPTGFDAERLIFLRVRVTDANGQQVFISGDRDPNGDVRDLHSLYVHNGELPQDKQLFSLQSRFLTRMVRGGEREQILAINYSPSPLPFIRPPRRAASLTARPTGARKHRRTLAPNESQWADYDVPEENLEGTTPPYTVRIKLIAQMVPVNLISEIKVAGFDYNMTPQEVATRVVEGAQTLYDWKVKLSPETNEAQIVSKTP